MALKRKLDAAGHAALAEAVRALYTQQTDGTFLLDAEPDDNVTGLQNTVTATRRERDALSLKLKGLEKYEGLENFDPTEIQAILAKFSGDEEQQMLKQGKTLDEIFAKRTQKMQDAHVKALKKVEDERDAYKTTSVMYTGRVLDEQLRQVHSSIKAFPEAAETVLLLGRAVFSLDKDGKAVALKDGEPVIGKDGKTPLTPAEWGESLKDTHMYLFPAASGSGTQTTGKANGGKPKTLSHEEFNAMSPQERAVKMTTEGYTLRE